jgi:hypothetical protein
MSSQSDRVRSAVRWRRPVLGLLAGLAAAAAIIVPSVLASGKTPTAAKTAPSGATTSQDNSCAGAPDPAFTKAVAQLEQAGTIDSTQAKAIDAYLYQACSVDGLEPLVNNETITAAQAQAVNDALVHAKMSLAGKTPPAGQAASQDNSCTGPPDPVFTSAVAQLEQAGTIDSTQAQAIDAELQGCTFDLQHLVDSGIITTAQAQAVNDALVHAKMTLASAEGAHHK